MFQEVCLDRERRDMPKRPINKSPKGMKFEDEAAICKLHPPPPPDSAPEKLESDWVVTVIK